MKVHRLLLCKALKLFLFLSLSRGIALADLADDTPKEPIPQIPAQPYSKTPGDTSSSGPNVNSDKKPNINENSRDLDRTGVKSAEQKAGSKDAQKEPQKDPQKDPPKTDASGGKATQADTSQNRDSRPSRNQKGKKGVIGPPVKFRADSMSGNRFQGEVNLKGNVNITQGDLLIRGDQASIEQDPKLGQLIRVSVDGKVYLEKIDETTGKKITASAKSAIYSAPNRNITFKGDASITRGTDRMNGNIINYNLSTGLIKAEKVDGMIQQND